MNFLFFYFIQKRETHRAYTKKAITVFLAIFLIIFIFQAPALAGGDEIVQCKSNAYKTFEEVEISGEELPADNDMLIFIVCVSAYLAVLAALLILIIARRKRNKVKALIVLTAVWLAAGATVVILALISANDETYPVYVEGAEYEKDDFSPYSFSEDQQAVIDAFGYPDGFLIMYVDGDRLETWYYYEEGFVLDFLEGIKIGEEEDSALTEIEAESTDFKPEDFVCAMTPGTALSAADIDSFVMVPLEGDLLEDAKLYYGQAIVMGFHEDELYYVETLLPED